MGDELEPRRSEKLAKALREESLAYGECLEREDGWRIRADAAEARVEALTKALEEITGPRDANSSYLGLFHEDQRIAAAALAGSTVESSDLPPARVHICSSGWHEDDGEEGRRYFRFVCELDDDAPPAWPISLIWDSTFILAPLPTPPKAEDDHGTR